MYNKNFKPAWWLRNAHLQTIWPTVCRRQVKNLVLTRERFELADGDFVDVDWVKQTAEAPIVLILTGLEGSIYSPYTQGMLRALQQQGWQAGILYFRSCSGELNRLPRTYHGGDTADLAFVIQQLKERYPHVPITAIGFSLGGNVLLKWLGETKDEKLLTAAVAISVPFELAQSAQRLNQGFSRLYEEYLLYSLHKKIRHKMKNQAPFALIATNKVCNSIYEFDDKLTAKLHGFSSATEYYLTASCRRYLSTISIPTLILQAKDDPFMTNDTLPATRELSKHISLELTEKGGHVGFITGNFPGKARYWLEERVPSFLSQYLTVN